MALYRPIQRPGNDNNLELRKFSRNESKSKEKKSFYSFLLNRNLSTIHPISKLLSEKHFKNKIEVLSNIVKTKVGVQLVGDPRLRLVRIPLP